MADRILIVDDEVMLTGLLADHLQNSGYETDTANDAKTALRLLKNEPHLILLDINMPGMDGLELCKTIRDAVACPIVFLTARITEQDKLNGFLTGGDDYITKPFSLPEITARIAAHLRREERSKNSPKLMAARELLINLSNRSVVYRGEEILFSKKEFDLLQFLAANAGQVFDRERLYEAVWGLDAEGDSSVIKEHIRKIRQKLHNATGEAYIDTVWGVGYRWNK
ncbi:MAG: response regulator transcription factor [Oscillospiraceae bacterium]|nr:response regulator transcription factor [Oscillospiraceae bacterium]